MSLARCGICNAPSMAGPICARHWARLEDVMARAVDIAPVLATGAAKGGESVTRSTTVTMPISVPVMDAKRALGDVLYAAQAVICPGVPRLVVRDAVGLLRAHRARLRQSWAAPVLLADLEPAVAQAVQAVDKPRGRMSIPGRCRECGPSMLHLAQGALVCDRCGSQMTISEVRGAA
jgi:hypothetical protein